MYSHHQQGEEEDLKKVLFGFLVMKQVIKKLEYTKTIGQGGLFNIKSGIFIFRSDFLKQEDEREGDGHIEHKFLHKIHLPLPSFQWNCIDFCPFPVVEESDLCVIFIITTEAACSADGDCWL